MATDTNQPETECAFCGTIIAGACQSHVDTIFRCPAIAKWKDEVRPLLRAHAGATEKPAEPPASPDNGAFHRLHPAIRR